MKKFPLKLVAVMVVILVAIVLMVPSVAPKRLKIKDDSLARLKTAGVSEKVLDKLAGMKDEYWPDEIKKEIGELIESGEIDGVMKKIDQHAEKVAIWHGRTIIPGLDLQGGMHLVIQVKTDKAIETRIDTIADDLHASFRKERVRYSEIKALGGGKIKIAIKETENIEGFDKVLEDEFKILNVLSRSTSNGLVEAVMNLPDEEIANIRKWAVEQSLETIRNRIDQFGVVEPDIRIQGDDRIQIQLPGIENTERAKNILLKVALLEFKLVDEDNQAIAAQVMAGQSMVPPGDELRHLYRRNPETGAEKKEPYLLKKRTLLTGEYLTDARVQIDTQFGAEAYVSITFNKKGAKKFERITEENVKKRLAIVLDGKVYSAPTIQEKIPGGRAQITGSFTMDEAHDLAIALRAGALPAPVVFLEERSVGPSLGQESINKGILSMIVGGILVVVFMVIYYRGAGLIANLALIANIILILAGLAAMRATLTLPGIAGMILTIGMAVDANVLIFERIREELATGKTPYSALAAGYNRATLTILDANVTTLIAALVLGQFGTGPIRGFAVTLSMGVVSSMFTALILTRVVFDYLLLDRKMKEISI